MVGVFWKIYKKRRGCQFATYPSLLALALPSPQDKQRASPRRAILYLILGRLLVVEGVQYAQHERFVAVSLEVIVKFARFEDSKITFVNVLYQ